VWPFLDTSNYITYTEQKKIFKYKANLKKCQDHKSETFRPINSQNERKAANECIQFCSKR